MTQASPQSLSAQTGTTGAMTNLVGRTARVDWRCVFLMWMVAVQVTMLFATVWPLIASESPRGIVGFLQRDLYIPPTVIVVVLLFCIGVAWRGIHPRWWLLLMMAGQGIYALAAFAYAIHSDITWTQFAGHGGLFFLGGAGINAAIPLQYEANGEGRAVEKNNLHNRIIRLSQSLLIPIVGAVLFLYAIGIAARPDAGIAMFIQSQFGVVVMAMIVFWMAVGGGVVIQNNISAGRLAVAIVGQGIYAVMAIAFLDSDKSVSLAGVMVHILFTITALIIVFIRTRDHARMLRERQRQRRGA